MRKITFLGFTKAERLALVIIFVFLAVVSGVNLRTSLRRSRDAQRMSDVQAIYSAMQDYLRDFGFFPENSSDGKIIACNPSPTELKQASDSGNLAPVFGVCEWSKDAIRDIFDLSYRPYLEKLPIDPQNSKGISYYYDSGTRRFAIYAYLEGKDEDGYDPKIEELGIKCGNKKCNYGKSYTTLKHLENK